MKNSMSVLYSFVFRSQSLILLQQIFGVPKLFSSTSPIDRPNLSSRSNVASVSALGSWVYRIGQLIDNCPNRLTRFIFDRFQGNSVLFQRDIGESCTWGCRTVENTDTNIRDAYPLTPSL